MAAGCGSHTAAVFDRDGALVAHCDVLTGVEWQRIINDVSVANVTVNPDGDCCERLRNLSTWRHKLVIWRDGEAVWEGPIQNITWQLGIVTISAADPLAWLTKRVPHETITFSGTDLATIAEWLIEDGFRPDDPGHTTTVIGPARVLGDRAYTVNRGQTSEHLSDLANSGIDWTAVGSTILVLPEQHTEPVGSLSDVDLPEGLTVQEDGASLVTRWVVYGSDTSVDTSVGEGGEEPGAPEVVGEAGGTDPYYGLLEQSRDDTSVLTEASAVASARSALGASLPAQLFISTEEVTLSPDAPVDVPRLVPGWCLDVATTQTCRNVQQRMKIMGVQVTEDAVRESVKVQLGPIGGTLQDAGTVTD